MNNAYSKNAASIPGSRSLEDGARVDSEAQEERKWRDTPPELFSPNITWLIEQMQYVKNTSRVDDVHGDIAEYVLDLHRQGFEMQAILSKLKQLADGVRVHHEYRYTEYALFLLRQIRKAKQKKTPMPLRWEDQPGMPKPWFLKEGI